jgi:Mce-associated membrane protein
VKATNDLLRAEADDSIGFTKIRDEVINAGQAEVVTFHTLDYRKVDEGLDNWEKSSTGALHDEVVGRRATSRQAIENAKTSTTAKALTVALTELDARAGTATMIAAMQLTVNAEGKQPEQKYLRIRATVQRTPDGWKLSGIGQVNVAG